VPSIYVGRFAGKKNMAPVQAEMFDCFAEERPVEMKSLYYNDPNETAAVTAFEEQESSDGIGKSVLPGQARPGDIELETTDMYRRQYRQGI
jgi:hypothetical protein